MRPGVAIDWDDSLLDALLDLVRDGHPLDVISDRMGMHDTTLSRGFCALMRRHWARKGAGAPALADQAAMRSGC